MLVLLPDTLINISVTARYTY